MQIYKDVAKVRLRVLGVQPRWRWGGKCRPSRYGTIQSNHLLPPLPLTPLNFGLTKWCKCEMCTEISYTSKTADLHICTLLYCLLLSFQAAVLLNAVSIPSIPYMNQINVKHPFPFLEAFIWIILPFSSLHSKTFYKRASPKEHETTLIIRVGLMLLPFKGIGVKLFIATFI